MYEAPGPHSTNKIPRTPEKAQKLLLGLRQPDMMETTPFERPARLGKLPEIGSSREVEEELPALSIDLPLCHALRPMPLVGVVRVSQTRCFH